MTGTELIKAIETCVEETKIEENLANESKGEEEVTMRNKSTCKILFEIIQVTSDSFFAFARTFFGSRIFLTARYNPR